MRWVGLTVILGLSLAGCASEGPTGQPTPLLTGVSGCFAGGEQGAAGILEVDPDYGTKFNGLPVMWPVGFTGLRNESGVIVLNKVGIEIARTGRVYYLSHGPVAGYGGADPAGVFTAAANCGYPWDIIDCGWPPSGDPIPGNPGKFCKA